MSLAFVAWLRHTTKCGRNCLRSHSSICLCLPGAVGGQLCDTLMCVALDPFKSSMASTVSNRALGPFTCIVVDTVSPTAVGSRTHFGLYPALHPRDFPTTFLAIQRSLWQLRRCRPCFWQSVPVSYDTSRLDVGCRRCISSLRGRASPIPGLCPRESFFQ